MCLPRKPIVVICVISLSKNNGIRPAIFSLWHGGRGGVNVVLHALGLAEALDAVAFRPVRGEMRHWQTGETLITRPLGDASVERFGYPYYHLHRADFHRVLESSVRGAQPGAVRLDARVEQIEQDGEGVRAVLASVSYTHLTLPTKA